MSPGDYSPPEYIYQLARFVFYKHLLGGKNDNNNATDIGLLTWK
jgi:hypothetical protein